MNKKKKRVKTWQFVIGHQNMAQEVFFCECILGEGAAAGYANVPSFSNSSVEYWPIFLLKNLIKRISRQILVVIGIHVFEPCIIQKRLTTSASN